MPMKSSKRKAKGPCLWPGCKLPGCFFTMRTLGLSKIKGYYCDHHERSVAVENLERLKEEPRLVPGPVQWSKEG